MFSLLLRASHFLGNCLVGAIVVTNMLQLPFGHWFSCMLSTPFSPLDFTWGVSSQNWQLQRFVGGGLWHGWGYHWDPEEAKQMGHELACLWQRRSTLRSEGLVKAAGSRRRLQCAAYSDFGRFWAEVGEWHPPCLLFVTFSPMKNKLW